MAQDYSGTDLAATWAAEDAKPAKTVEIQWDGTNWTDETSRVRKLDIDAQLYTSTTGLAKLGMVPSGRANLLMSNFDNRYSPANASGALYSDIQNGIHRIAVRISLGYYSGATPETLRQFTGYIWSAPEWEDARQGKCSRLECMDVSEMVRQHKHTSVLISDNRVDQIIGTLLDVPTSPTVSHSQDQAHSMIPYAGLDDENIWDQCQKLAAADGGWIYCKKDGTLVFERMTHWVEGTDHTASNATLDVGNAWWLQDSINWRDVYTDVTVPWQPREVGVVEVVYEAMEPIELAPSEVRTIKAKFDYMVSSLITPVSGTDYEAVTAGMGDINSDLTVAVTGYCKQASIELTNGNTNHTMWVIELQLRGYPLMGRETHEITKTEDASVISGKKRWQEPANFYMQTEIQAERKANFLRDFLERPRRLLGWRGPACPWLELGDRVHVDHKTATYNPGIDVDGYVLAISQNCKVRWEQTLKILPVTNLWNKSSYFKLGTDLYKDSGATALFY